VKTKFQPFYVGKGKGNRYQKHLYETESSHTNDSKFDTIQSILQEGLLVNCEIFRENLTEHEAYELEEEIIFLLGRERDGGILTNIAFGGRSPSALPEVRRKIGNANRGRKQSEEHIQKRVEKNTGQKRTKEQRKRIQQATVGIKRTKEARRNIQRAARNRSQEHNQHISNSLKGRSIPESVREKISQTLKGKAKPKRCCPHCGIVCAHNVLKRFHMDNCKCKK